MLLFGGDTLSERTC